MKYPFTSLVISLYDVYALSLIILVMISFTISRHCSRLCKLVSIFKLLSRALGICCFFSACLFACSSAQDFKSSRPIEEASSYTNALILCAEYQIPVKKNSNGYPLSVDGAVLTPWLRCFEKVLRLYPESRHSSEYLAFFRALKTKYDVISHDVRPQVELLVMNDIVKQIIGHLTHPIELYDMSLVSKIKDQLPGFEEYLVKNERILKKEIKPVRKNK